MSATAIEPVVMVPTACRVGRAFAPSPTRLIPAVSLRRMCRRERVVCLTFDDGPGPVLTREVLAVLAGEGARGTFFALGSRATATPEVLDEVAAAGHEVGCHTLNHTNAWRAGSAAAAADVAAGYGALSRWVEAGGLFRPPYGRMSPATMAELRRRGAPVCWWTIDGGDTRDRLPAVGDAPAALARAGGGVVLLHDFDRVKDSAARAGHVIESVRLLLACARREGISVRPIGELVGLPA